MSNDISKALQNIGYGLYAVTCFDGVKHNALIVNSVTQLTSSPNRILVTINKQNYSHQVIKQTGKLNLNCLTTSTPFSVFEDFGFKTGSKVDKLKGYSYSISKNGLAYLNEHINSFMSLKVESYVDMDSHGMFICTIEEGVVFNQIETMTYSYYHANVKPKPQTSGKTGYVCTICGYFYDGDPLPEDFVCPLCKHGASDFEKVVR